MGQWISHGGVGQETMHGGGGQCASHSGVGQKVSLTTLSDKLCCFEDGVAEHSERAVLVVAVVS
jgi:hypothetical protein